MSSNNAFPVGTFPWAIKAIVQGYKVRRKVWADDVCIGMHRPDEYGEDALYTFHYESLAQKRYEFGFKHDIMAKDWELVG